VIHIRHIIRIPANDRLTSGCDNYLIIILSSRSWDVTENGGDRATEPVAFRMSGISKRYPGVVAVKDVDFTLRRGEVHGLVGENGAGKSTLMNILAGAIAADEGAIEVDGRVISAPTPLKMIELGVAVIHQELMQAAHLTVAENIFLGRLPTARFGRVDWRRVERDSVAVMDRLGFSIDPRQRVGNLSVAQRQVVEIAGALSRNARIVVLDEPSAVLAGAELTRLFETIERLATSGVSFVYISHRLPEVFRICSRVTVLRDGVVVGTQNVSEVGPDDLIRMMIGRVLADAFPRRQRRYGPPLLTIRGLTRPGILHDIDLDVREGEILGICGLAGSGRSELLRAIVAADPSRAAAFELGGNGPRPKSPRAAISRGIGLLPEDRKTDGCFLPQSVAFNVTIARLPRFGGGLLLNGGGERQAIRELTARLNIRMRDAASRIAELSGGNQQKCMVARTLNARCRILLVDEPTRGVDVGAKRDIYQLLTRLADEERVAIMMVSSDLPEVLGISDRILVMRDGRVAGRFEPGEATEEAILQCAVGAHGIAA
jgi:ribose transport system ATP-binding protein